MSNTEQRRKFLKISSLLRQRAWRARCLDNRLMLKTDEDGDEGMEGIKLGEHSDHPEPKVPADSDVKAEYDGYSRFKPSRGNDPDSDYYLGKADAGLSQCRCRTRSLRSS